MSGGSVISSLSSARIPFLLPCYRRFLGAGLAARCSCFRSDPLDPLALCVLDGCRIPAEVVVNDLAAIPVQVYAFA